MFELDLVFLMANIMGIVEVGAMARGLAFFIGLSFGDANSFCDLVARSLI
jgi:hypothetical protein